MPAVSTTLLIEMSHQNKNSVNSSSSSSSNAGGGKQSPSLSIQSQSSSISPVDSCRSSNLVTAVSPAVMPLLQLLPDPIPLLPLIQQQLQAPVTTKTTTAAAALQVKQPTPLRALAAHSSSGSSSKNVVGAPKEHHPPTISFVCVSASLLNEQEHVEEHSTGQQQNKESDDDADDDNQGLAMCNSVSSSSALTSISSSSSSTRTPSSAAAPPQKPLLLPNQEQQQQQQQQPQHQDLLFVSKKASVDLIKQFHALCGQEFTVEELESESCWIDRLNPARQRCPVEIVFSFVLAVDQQGIVRGGATLEFFPSCNSGLLGFVVVDRSLRGQRLAPRILGHAKVELSRMAATATPASSICRHIFIDVAQARDADPADAEFAAVRQKIWTKMGFFPLEGVDLLHPGTMAHGRYHVAVLSMEDETARELILERATVVEFLVCYYASAALSLQYEQKVNSPRFHGKMALEQEDEDAFGGGPVELAATIDSIIVGEDQMVRASAEFWK